MPALLERWPGREEQVQRLYDAFLGTSLPGPSVFISGGPSTGKTGVCREVIESLGWRHAYINCCSSLKARQLLSSIVSQLQGTKRKRGQGYALSNLCDSGAELSQALAELAPPGSPGVVLMLDNVHELARSSVLEALLQVAHGGSASLCVLLIGRLAWSSGAYASLPPPALHLTFPHYSNKQLLAVLEMDAPSAIAALPPAAAALPPGLLRTCYTSMLSALVLDTFSLLSRDLALLRRLAAALWPGFIAPLLAGQGAGPQLAELPPEQLVRRLYTSALDKHVPRLLASAKSGRMPDVAAAAGGRAATGMATAVAQPCQGQAAGAELLDLSAMSKLLLVSAFVASNNKATLDKALFDAVVAGGRGRVGRRSTQASDRQAEAAKESYLKGPQAFGLQRLLMIAGKLCPTSLANLAQTAQALAAGSSANSSGCTLSTAAALTCMGSLLSLHLVSRVGACVEDALEGARYCCNIGEPLATRLAADVGIKLSNYLRYA